MRCAIWYHLYTLKKVKNTHGGVLFLLKFVALACNFTTKSNTPPGVYFTFLSCTNLVKLRKASHMELLPRFKRDKIRGFNP